MNTYIVKTPLNHDTVEYAKGQEVQLTEEVAKDLLRDGVIREVGAEAEEEAEAPVQPAVNEVKREGGDVDGDASVSEGAETETTNDDDDEAGDDTADSTEGDEGSEGAEGGADEGTGEGESAEGDGDNL